MTKLILAFCATMFAPFLFNASKISAQLSNISTPTRDQKITGHSVTKTQITYVIIKNRQGNFGYDILNGNRIIIHQLSVPGLQGKEGFITKRDAAKVALLVVRKINKNIFPPTITRQELQSLKINNY
jgi:hypothetical protein